MKPIKLALSYNDVLLVPHKSRLESRSEVDLSTQISPNIKLDIPLISINMDTVTG
ncbi:guanosine monophosphate reductase, partial [Candidatus Dojkabacteria bacterium]